MPTVLRKALILTTPLWAAAAIVTVGMWASGPAPARAVGAPPTGDGTGAAPVNTQTVVPFRPLFETGSQTRYSIRARRVTQIVTPSERTDRYDERIKTVVTATVERPLEPGGAIVAITFDEIEMEVGSPEKKWRYRSRVMHAERQGDAIGEACKRILNQTIRLRLDEAGKIAEVLDAEEFLKEPDLRRFTERLVGDVAVKRLFSFLFAPPGAPAEAGVGQAWTYSVALEDAAIEGLEFEADCSVVSADAPLADIKVLGQGEIHGGGAKTTLSMSSISGAYTWNFERGMLHKTEINAIFAGDVGEGDEARAVGGESSITISLAD